MEVALRRGGMILGSGTPRNWSYIMMDKVLCQCKLLKPICILCSMMFLAMFCTNGASPKALTLPNYKEKYMLAVPWTKSSTCPRERSRVKKEAAEIYMFPRLSLLTTKKWFFFFFFPIPFYSITSCIKVKTIHTLIHFINVEVRVSSKEHDICNIMIYYKVN